MQAKPISAEYSASFFSVSLKEIYHNLFAILHKIMYVSLMTENVRRMQHLEGAAHHLDDKSAELLRKCNALRQEEIIEEIEVILRSASDLDQIIMPLESFIHSPLENYYDLCRYRKLYPLQIH